MAQTDYFMAPGAFDAEAEQLRRRKAMADMLTQQGMQTPQGQMVSGHYVAPSWAQYLDQGAGSIIGAKLDRDVTTGMKSLGEQRRAEGIDDTTKLIAALRGSPAQTIQPATPNDDEGNPNQPIDMAAKGPDLVEALRVAQTSRNPALNAAAGSIMTSMLPKTPKWTVAERFNDKTGQSEKVMYDANNPTDIRPFGGQKAVKMEVGPAGQAYNPYTIKPGSVLRDPNKPFYMDENGQMQPNPSYQQYEMGKAKAGAAQVSVNTATKPFLGEIGKGVGEQVVSDFGGARSAVSTLNNVNQMEAGLSKVIVGPTANARIKLAQIGEVLGVNGADTTEKLQNTRNLMQGLARQELAAAGSMKGQGQITESERAILRKAESGNVDELTVPELRTLIGALKKTANYRIAQHNANLGRLKKDPNAAGIVDYMTLEAPMMGGNGWSIEAVK